MNQILVNQGSADTSRNPSAQIWGSCPWEDLIGKSPRGIAFYDEFTDLPLAPDITTQVAFGKYKAYAATGCTISRVSSVNSTEIQGGALQIAMDTDNDEASIAQAYPGFFMSGLSSTSGKLWFECCYAQNSIVTNLASTFFGFAETDLFTLGANVPNNSGDAIDNSGAIIGFRIEEDGLGVVDTVYSDRATSFTNIGDTEGGTLAANTFTKFGMIYDPGQTDNCVTFYVNGVKCTTALSRSALQALTNLDANALGLIWSVAADSAGTSFKGYMKWWRAAQMYPGEAA